MASREPDLKASRPLYPRIAGRDAEAPPQVVAADQRRRLQGAMVELASRHGFAGTTLSDLVALAGVSNSTFYELFGTKEALFFATFDAIVDEFTSRVRDSLPTAGDRRDRFAAALSRCMELVGEDIGPAYLVAVESLTLGSAAEGHRERSWRPFERMVRDAFGAGGMKLSERAARAIVSGLRGVVYRRLRDRRTELLPGYAEELVERGLRFGGAESEAARCAREAAERPPAIASFADPHHSLSWQEPPDSRRSRAALSQRDRIVRAAARLVCEKGYGALSVPAISAAAGVSNQTFYEHFEAKRDAFLEAYDLLAERAFQLYAAAFGAAGGGAAGVGAGMRMLLEYGASDWFWARLTFLELPSAGPLGLNRFDEANDRYAQLLAASPIGDEPPPEIVLTAIGTGVWGVIRHEVANDRAEALPAIAPELAALAITPIG